MAVIHRARIAPSKAQLMAAWLPSRPWSDGGEAPLEILGAYRFDDPAGEVGIETHLVRTAGGRELQVPLTYRGSPLDGAAHHLVGTTEHSHLGRRWVYDGCGDPVYAAVLETAIRSGGREAEQWVDTDDGPRRRTVTTHVTGSGTADAAALPIAAVDTMTVVEAIASVCAVTAVDGTTVTTIKSTIAPPGCELVVLRALTPSPPAEDRTDGRTDGHFSGVETLTGIWPGRVEPALLAVLRG